MSGPEAGSRNTSGHGVGAPRARYRLRSLASTSRALALPTVLVDNEVCAIDDTWYGVRRSSAASSSTAPSTSR